MATINTKLQNDQDNLLVTDVPETTKTTFFGGIFRLRGPEVGLEEYTIIINASRENNDQ